MSRKSLELAEKVFGKEHPRTLARMGSLAVVLADMCKYNEAERIYVETLGLAVRVWGKEHSETRNCLENFVAMLQKLGRYEEAASVLDNMA